MEWDIVEYNKIRWKTKIVIIFIYDIKIFHTFTMYPLINRVGSNSKTFEDFL